MIEINSNITYMYESYMEGKMCTIKIYMKMDKFGSRAEEAFYDFIKISREDSGTYPKNGSKWGGSHWDTPQVVASEQVEDIQMSDDMAKFIKLLNAEHLEED